MQDDRFDISWWLLDIALVDLVLRYKGSELFWIEQIKITFGVIFAVDEVPEWDSELMDKEEMEYPTTSRDNRRIFSEGKSQEAQILINSTFWW